MAYLGYGYTSDNDESLKGKTGGRFGLNAGNGLLSKFAYSANVAKEGEPAREAIELTVKVGDREYREWINPVTRVVDKNNNELTPNTPEHEAAYNILMKQQQAVVVHYLKAVGVTDEAIQLGLNVPMTGFADYAARVCALLPVGFDVKPLDVFLEYQWNFGKKADGELNDKTFPTLPKNMKGGYFVVPAQPGVWVESVQEDGSLCYKNSNGAKHPFDKDANFMKGNKGTQQVSGAAAQTASPMAAQAPVGAATGKW